MEIKEFNDTVLDRFTGEITDLVFQYILTHDDLMNAYLDLVSEKGRQQVNSHLGKAIKNRFGIDNDGKGEPQCVLIKTAYTKHN